MLRGVLGGGRKRKRGALSYLAGGGQSSFLNASTLLTVAGVAWGLWESAQASSAAVSATTRGARRSTVRRAAAGAAADAGSATAAQARP